MFRQLIRDEGETRLYILERIEDARQCQHRMRYHFEESVTLKPGTWTIYVHLPRLRRHKIWHGVVFPHDEPVVLEYAWANHATFGR